MNKKHMVTQITIDFSGAVNITEADRVGTYRLAAAGKKGSFTAKNAAVLRLKSAVYEGALDQVTLTPKRAFALTKPVEFVVDGQALQDSSGRLIDGAGDNQPGSNFVTILRRTQSLSQNKTNAPTRTPAPTPPPGFIY